MTEADDVVFLVGAQSGQISFEGEEPAEFVYDNLVHYAAVQFSTAETVEAPCHVDGASEALPFGIDIRNGSGGAYEGPVTIEVKALQEDAAAHVAVAGKCATKVEYGRWEPGLVGSVSLGETPPEDGDGELALKVVLKIPNVEPVVIIPGKGAKSDRYDSLTPEPESARVPPQPFVDHWHVAYGIYICDRFLPPLTEERDPKGIHTHNDGLIHVHPFGKSAAGANATLGVFAATVGLTLSDDVVAVGGSEYRSGRSKCGNRTGAVQVRVQSKTITKRLESIRLIDGEAITIAFVPPGAEIPPPPCARHLDMLHPQKEEIEPAPDSRCTSP